MVCKSSVELGEADDTLTELLKVQHSLFAFCSDNCSSLLCFNLILSITLGPQCRPFLIQRSLRLYLLLCFTHGFFLNDLANVPRFLQHMSVALKLQINVKGQIKASKYLFVWEHSFFVQVIIFSVVYRPWLKVTGCQIHSTLSFDWFIVVISAIISKAHLKMLFPPAFFVCSVKALFKQEKSIQKSACGKFVGNTALT